MTRCLALLCVLLLIAWLRPANNTPQLLLSDRSQVPSVQEPTRLPYYDDAGFTANWGSPHHSIRPFHLTDQTGAAFTERNLDGHVTVVGFFYPACNGICPQTLRNEERLQTAFGNDPRVQLVSVAVTPESPSSLQTCARLHRARTALWRFLTGDVHTVERLQRVDCFSAPYGEDAGAPTPPHSENLVLVDRQRHLRGLYRGTLILDMDRAAHDIRTLEREGP